MKNQKKTPEKACNIIEISEWGQWEMVPVDKDEYSIRHRPRIGYILKRER